MKVRLIASVAALTLSAFTAAMAANPPGWTDNYEKAVEKAKAESKKLVLLYTASNISFCQVVDKEVIASAYFKNWAKDYVLVRVENPTKTLQPEKLRKQNTELKERYALLGLPTLLVLDTDGKEQGRFEGYHLGMGPEAYLNRLADRMKP